MRYYLGVDGGGSVTRAAVVSETLEVLGRGLAGPEAGFITGASLTIDGGFTA